METLRLRQFCTVVETGNLRKAATLLGISHSGLFKSLKTFEAELGFPLFLPSGRGIVVTDQGRHLYERSGSFFSALDQLVGKKKSQNLQPIRIGSFEVFTSHFIGRFLKSETKEDIDVEVHELIPGRLEEALLLGKVDLGITYDPVPRAGIDYVRVTQIGMGAYTLKGAFRGMDCLSLPFVVPVTPLESSPSGVKGRDAWPEERFKRKISYRVDLMNTGLELVRQGLCAIFIPQFVAKNHNEMIRSDLRLEERALPKGMPDIKREVYLVKRESTEENQVLKNVAQALRSLS